MQFTLGVKPTWDGRNLKLRALSSRTQSLIAETVAIRLVRDKTHTNPERLFQVHVNSVKTPPGPGPTPRNWSL